MRISLLALLCSLTISIFAAPPLLRNTRSLPTLGSEPYVGDFGGDAAQDVLTIRGNSIRVLINGATGIFDAPVITPIIETGIISAHIAELNGDDDLDVVLTAVTPPQAVVYLGSGNGTFTRGAVIAGANGGVATGDFTGDGHVDIVVAGSAINVYPGNGSGGFGAPVTTSLSNEVSKVQAFDANGDGKLDLLAARQWTMYVALGNGSGGFTMSSVGETDVYNNSFAIGDFDENGTPDFVNVANVGLTDGVLLVFLGQGNGTFTKAAELGGLPHFAVTVADVNKDGHLDLVGSSDRGNLAVFPGNGDGTFDDPHVWHTGPVWALSIGEFNRDTNLDVVLFCVTNNHLQFLAGMPAGTFDTYRSYLPGGSTPWWDDGGAARLSVIADMNNDGSPDTISTVIPESYAHVEIAVMLNANDGSGALHAPFQIETDSDARMRLVAGDVNNDGNQDIVAIMSPGVQTFLGNGDGTLDPPLTMAVNTNGYPRIADMNGDGALDLILTRYDTSTVLRGTNTGTFGNPTTVAFPIHAIGDVNGDGRLDVLGHPSLGTLLGFNHGDGTFSTMGFPDGDYPGVGDLADMNGDGHLDMLLILYSGTRVRFGNGDGTFAPNAIDFSIEPRVANDALPISGSDLVRTGDFDNDGHLDFVDGPNFYLGNGDGRFRSFANVMVHGWSTFGVADFDGNGTDDVALTTAAGSISIVRTNLGPDAPLTPGITLTPAKTSPQHGETVAYTAALTASEPLPGKVLFARNGVPVALLSHANFLVAADIAASSGSATISATYTGDDRYAPATATVQQTVVKATTALSVEEVFPEFAYCGQELFLYVPLSAPRGSGVIGPQGELIFRVGETVLPARRDPAEPLPYNYVVGGLSAGTHTITAEFPGDANYLASSISFTQTILPPIDLNARAGSGIHPNSTGYAEARFTYAPIEWTITNGTIVEGQGTTRIRYTSGASGEVTLRVAYTAGACGSGSTVTVPILNRPAGASLLYLVTPCRALDTRNGTILGTNATREISLAGTCGIPSDAKALAVTITTVTPSNSGWLSFYPSDLPWPGTSVLSYRTGRTRANNATIALSNNARVTVKNGGPAVHFIIDVLGYFR